MTNSQLKRYTATATREQLTAMAEELRTPPPSYCSAAHERSYRHLVASVNAALAARFGVAV